MRETSYMDGTEIKGMCEEYIKYLKDENDAYVEACKQISSFVEYAESNSKSINGLKEHMDDCKLGISALMVANEDDIRDAYTFIDIVKDTKIVGSSVLQYKKQYKKEMDSCQSKVDEYRRKRDNATTQSEADTYDQLRGEYSYLLASASSNYNYYVEKENLYDDLNDKSKKLFLDSVGVRNEAHSFFNVLNSCYANGSYDTEKIKSYRDGLSRKLNYWDNWKLSDGSVDINRIFEDLDQVDGMSDAKYKEYIAALKAMGIDVPWDCPRDELRKKIMEWYSLKYNDPNAYNGKDGDWSPFDSFSPEQIELFVLLWESDPNNADEVEKVKNFCSKFDTDENRFPGWEKDVINIKFLLYNAEEPYKSYFINNCNKIKFGDLHGEGGTNGLVASFPVEEFHRNKPPKGGDYSTFFHECGHAIDNDKVSKQNINGTTLQDELFKELKKRIYSATELWLDENTSYSDLEKEIIKEIIRRIIMNNVSETLPGPDFNYLADYYKSKGLNITGEQLKKCYDGVVDKLCYTTDAKGNKTLIISGPLSDAFGGFTGNILRTGNGHPSISYDSKKNPYFYWINNGGHDNKGLYIKVKGKKIYSTDPHFQDYLIINDAVEHSKLISAEIFTEYMDSKITKRKSEVEDFNTLNKETKDFLDSLYK